MLAVSAEIVQAAAARPLDGQGWRQVGELALALVLVAVSGTFGSSVGGMLASRIGTRRTIIVAMAGSAFFTALLALNGPYPATVVTACFISAFNRGCQPAAIATVGELASADQRVPMFGFYQLALNLGAAAGPLTRLPIEPPISLASAKPTRT